MKGGFLKPRPEKKDETKGTKDWDDKTLEMMVLVFQDVLDDKGRMVRLDIERRVRSGTGAKEVSTGHGHAHYVDTLMDPEELKNDTAAKLIQEFTREASLRDMVGPVIEQSATMFERIKSRGLAEKMVMDSETEKTVKLDVLKEVLTRHILKCINAENSQTYAAGSSDAGLLATPQGYSGGDLNSLDADCVRDFMEKGYGYVDDFLDETALKDVHNELELMEFDGKFMEVQQQKMLGMRTDKIMWMNYGDLDREKQMGLGTLFKKLISIPFELNKKCNLCLQANATFQLAHYGKKGYYKKHVDGGYEDINNGRKVTCIYYANKSWTESDGGALRMYKRRRNPYEIEKMEKEGLDVPKQEDDEVVEEIAPVGNRLVVFRSRDMPHQVLETARKRFAVTLWLLGPPGPGDQPDGHYTPS
mmetsp:Transcript_24549/g.56608  ORF Transcript_24549/g.56608 Transcript_24549/m.56608 type:complete len:417 (+) Transcript_24549:59-1309(+)